MASFRELRARIEDFYRFSADELGGLAVAAMVAAIVFSFRDWGEEQFNLMQGITHLLLMLLIVSISLLFRISCQKVYALSQGQNVKYEVWFTGMFISLVVAFITKGTIPLLLLGAVTSSFMVRQRLGEFRYGFSYYINGMAAFWGIIGSLLMAMLFAIGIYFWGDHYFLLKGLYFNLIFALCVLIPIPKLEGLPIYFGNRFMYAAAIVTVALFGVLLLSRTRIGLVLAILIATIAALIFLLISSNR